MADGAAFAVAVAFAFAIVGAPLAAPGVSHGERPVPKFLPRH
jgi:hypothetical protein